MHTFISALRGYNGHVFVEGAITYWMMLGGDWSN